MAVPGWAAQDIVVLRPALIDDRGTMITDWAADPVSQTTVPGCSVQPAATDETLQARDQVTIRWTVYAPPGIDITATDLVLFDGVTYAVDGAPRAVTSASGSLDHVRVDLIDWSG